MNYANMIEEKNLKKGFIIATLVSTLAGTLTTSLALHDKIQDKRRASKQKGVDTKQTDEIKQLREKVDKIQNGEGRNGNNGGAERIDSGRSSLSQSRRRIRDRDDYDDDDDFAYAARRSRAMIERTYEDNLRRMGQGYAQGDLITENKLQAQIIQLQQTVIGVLQDALYNGRPLTEGDLNRLIAAQNAARDGSLDALQGQYTRMLAEKRTQQQRIAPREYHDAPQDRLFLDDIPAPLPRHSTFPLARTPPMRRSPPPQEAALFCRYAESLQGTSRPLGPSFEPREDHCCPSCNISIPVDTRDVWTFSMRTPSGKARDFRMDARFVVKCHMPEGRFACVLCDKYRDVDCICRDVDALVKHLGTAHSVDDFDGDRDLMDLQDEVVGSGRELVVVTN